MHETLALDRPLEQTPQLEESITCLQCLFQNHRNTCVIASVDFSHIGPKFGDMSKIDTGILKKVEQVDRDLLAALENVAHEDFVAQLRQHHNATRVCGIVPMYTMLRLLEGTKGSLLHYDRAETAPGSFVTFASMVWKSSKEQVAGSQGRKVAKSQSRRGAKSQGPRAQSRK
jgi:AmmeMemoRadiSam system protein B